ncbi:TIGR02444 family protein [Pigmentiphaga aceris]|nr:TIGR02444 family protein [Pigmentiphaga aceris]
MDIPTQTLPAFSGWLYAGDDVPAACLHLQDELGLDVNMLLWCLYAGVRGTALTSEMIATADAACAPWRAHVVHPLREVRRWLKTAGPQAQALRKQILAQEIDSEWHQQGLIEAAVSLDRQPASSWIGASNLAAYMRWAQVTPTVEATQAVRTLLASAYPAVSVSA